MSKTKVISGPSERLFADVQGDLFEKSYKEKVRAEKNKPVECLGLTFPNGEHRNPEPEGWFMKQPNRPPFLKEMDRKG